MVIVVDVVVVVVLYVSDRIKPLAEPTVLKHYVPKTNKTKKLWKILLLNLPCRWSSTKAEESSYSMRAIASIPVKRMDLSFPE